MKRFAFFLLVVLTMTSAVSCKKDNPSPSKDNPSIPGDKPSTSGGSVGRTDEFGYYWSSSMLSTSDGSPDNAWAYVSSTTDGAVSKGDFLRCFGLSVRPVCTE